MNHTVCRGERPFAPTTVVYLPENCCKYYTGSAYQLIRFRVVMQKKVKVKPNVTVQGGVHASVDPVWQNWVM